MPNARIGGPPGAMPASRTRASSTSRDFPANHRCDAIVPSRTSPSRKCRSPASIRVWSSALIAAFSVSPLVRRVLELEPEEAARAERQQVRELADPRERRVAEELHRHASGERRQVELDRLRGAGEVVDAEDDVLRERADVREDL